MYFFYSQASAKTALLKLVNLTYKSMLCMVLYWGGLALAGASLWRLWDFTQLLK
jgi:hypothetical protein